jgi:putative lipoprotein
MTLNPDHSANTTYSYQNGEADTVERGYWQQLNPNQVQVANTQLQNQPLNSERIYTRDGYQLTAKKEKVGDVIYEIADGGITLFKTKQTLTESVSSPTTRTLKAGKVASSAEFNPQVDKTLREYFRLHKTDPTGTRYRWLTYDLNGDGNEELLAQLDWCGSGGCTLLIFENYQQKWRFNSRITLVRTPINLGTQAHDGWQDLILFVSGGGAVPNQHVLKHNSISYPQNPSVAPTANYDESSQVQLFSDGLTPHQGGVTL